jgi:hypothetical protein
MLSAKIVFGVALASSFALLTTAVQTPQTTASTVTAAIGYSTTGGHGFGNSIVPLRDLAAAGRLSSLPATVGQSLVTSCQLCTQRLWLPVAPVSPPTVAVAAGGCLGYVRRAQRAVDTERESVTAERAAFESFAEAVASMQTATLSQSPTAHASHGSNRTLAAVRQQYRETVLSVPDYESVYDEGLCEHMTAEFGESVATVVAAGGALTPTVQQLLIQGAEASAAERATLIDTLATEADSLSTAADCLTRAGQAVETPNKQTRSVSRLIEHEEQLRTAEQDCTALLDRRQEQIHAAGCVAEPTLQEYLYTELEPTFPVLASTLTRIEQLRDNRLTVAQAIADRA